MFDSRSRYRTIVDVVNLPARRSHWTFLTNHAHVLVCVALDPTIRTRDIAAQVGVTERSAQSIIADLVSDGYIERSRDGRRNRYRIIPTAHLRHDLERDTTVGDLLAVIERSRGTALATG